MNSTQQIENLISQGRYLEAQHGAEALLKEKSDRRLDQLYALALSKSGAPDEAMRYIEPFYKSNDEDPETAGILGSIYKALFKKNQQSSFALQSRDTYLQNFTATNNPYTGINAAAMSAMIMQGSKSKEIANQIISMISPDATDFWDLATLGEAHLLTRQTEKSTGYYVKAKKAAGNDWGKINSVYDQLWLLNHYMPVQKEIMRLFSPPGVVAFIGHMVDHPSRPEPRFPPSIESQVKESIMSNLMTINAHIGFCSLACGSDILFAESMAELDRELNIFLPFCVPDFIEASLIFAGETWVQRFKHFIETYPVKMITVEPYAGHDPLFNFQSKIIFGSAMLRSAAQQNKTTLLTVLSETDLKKNVGGTNFSINLWPYRDRHVNINPDIFVARDAVINSVSAPGHPVDSLPHRKIWHHVAIDTSALTRLYGDTIHKEIIRLNESAILFHTTQISKDLNVYSFDSEFPAFDLMNQLQRLSKTFPKGQHASTYLHSGLASENEVKLTGDAIDTVIEMSHLNVPGIQASEHAAALLALQPNTYNLEFAGIVVLKNEKRLAMYRVRSLNA